MNSVNLWDRRESAFNAALDNNMRDLQIEQWILQISRLLVDHDSVRITTSEDPSTRWGNVYWLYYSDEGHWVGSCVKVGSVVDFSSLEQLLDAILDADDIVKMEGLTRANA